MNLKHLMLPTLFLLPALPADASQPLRRQVMKPTIDGRTVVVTRRGNECISWWETADGQHFTMTADRTLEPAKLRDVQRSAPHRGMAASTEDGLGAYAKSGNGVVCSLGSPLIPVIVVAFSDLDFLAGNDLQKIDRFLNEEGYADEPLAKGSVRDYYVHSSSGAFTPRFEVVGKVVLPKDYKYYGGHVGAAVDAHRSELLSDAVRLAESQGIDFSRFATDGRVPLVSILHAGPGEQEDYGDDYEDYLWAHFSQTAINGSTATFGSYLLTNECMRDFDGAGNVTGQYMTGIGTFCHEFGHALGLPDIYDVNGSVDDEGQTPGYWDIMDYQFMMDGFQPMEFSGYERSMLGWVKAEELPAVPAGETYRLAPLNDDETADSRLFCLRNPQCPQEYFLLENRRSSTFYASRYLGEGVLVWHVDYNSSAWAGNQVNVAAAHQRVAVVPADGEWQPNSKINAKDADGQRYTFTGDIFPGYTDKRQFDGQDADFYVGKQDCIITNIHVEDDGCVSFTYGTMEDIRSVRCDDVLSAPTLYDLWGRSAAFGYKATRGLSIDENGKKIIR